MFKSGITKRWILTTLLLITVILIATAAVVTFSVREYYYNIVRSKLQSMGQSGSVSNYFTGYIGASDSAFAERAREYVYNSPDSNTAWLWVYDKDGDVVVTSTGFPAAEIDCDDYAIALESPSGRGLGEGSLSSGEKVMALTVLLPKTEEKSNGAVRYITSLEEVNRKVKDITVIAGLFVLFSETLVILSGLFFVRSIVGPVKNINSAARRIAKGDYSEKVEVAERFDEITELSRSINYMTDELAKTDRLKNDFISTVSHELRTPLTAIKGWTETLISMDEEQDETLRQGLQVILAESERLYSLVEDLLDFSRMESGGMGLRVQKIDILAELDEAVYVLRDRARREGIEIFYSTPDYPAPADGDPDRVKQVFVNVIDNAIKYTPAGGQISIVAALEQGSVRITVSDTGCGIPESDLPHVKEKFYKANMSVKGSGIGLAVCEEIVTRHNGKLIIKSKENEGTTVDIVFPLAPASQTEGKS
ncbi:MAG: HAMP domain-containing histidine kinase [Clostridia bacterium]|nr:HAMP domain-containing histidine kinase [Clostridia bacterium]